MATTACAASTCSSSEHVHAEVLRRVRPESPGRLLELALAADAVPAAGLVPRHGHVHQPLVEVALAGLGGAPGVLELLVRREVLAAADQVEAGFEVVHTLETRRDGVTFAAWRRSCWWGSTSSSAGSSRGCCRAITSLPSTASTRPTRDRGHRPRRPGRVADA